MRGLVAMWMGGAVLVAAGCSTSGAKPGGPPKPDIVVPTPVMFDLSQPPARPVLVNAAPSHIGMVTDPKTGKLKVGQVVDTTVVVDTVAPDTNDARTYFAAGVAARGTDDASAVAAFYWASRLNPSWAEPYFARWYTLVEAARPVMQFKTGKTSGPLLSDSVRKRIDSLMVQAEIHDPYFDEAIRLSDASGAMRGSFAIYNSMRRSRISEYNRERMSRGQVPLMGIKDVEIPRIWYTAYAQGHFDSAAKALAPLIKKYPDEINLYVYRSKAFYYTKQYDSAAATLTAAIGRVEKRDTTRILPVYFSKEMFTYSIAMAQSAAHHDSVARLTFQRTVTENLGFYMAHLHLASAALGVHDTTTALNEARIAAEISPRDPVVQLFLGYSLFNANHPDEAIEHLRMATEVDPEFALPYYYLGQSMELKHDTAGAVGGYRAFLAHASRTDNLRATVMAALFTLERPTAH